MTARRVRRVLTLSAAALAGYTLGRSTTAYGFTPAVVLTAVCVTAWCAGWLRSHALHSAVTATAQRERDTACALAVSVTGRRHLRAPAVVHRQDRSRPLEPAGRPVKPSQMYANDWCTHHAVATRVVGRRGSAEERQQCDRCEAEWWQSVDRLTRRDVA